MTWNHRVCKTTNAEWDETFYHIHEVYYNEDGSIWAWTANPASPYGETLEELKTELAQMLAACKFPVLDLDTIVPAPRDGDRDEDDKDAGSTMSLEEFKRELEANGE